MSHLLLIRHGETELNRENQRRTIFNGQAETPLTEVGIMQAAETGKTIAALPHIHLQLAVSSTLERSIATARLFLEQLPYSVPFVLSDALRERSLGIFEGRYADDVYAEFPEYRDDPAFKHFRQHFDQKAPDGENLTEVTARAWGSLQSLETQCAGDLAVFSHAITIRCLVGKALALPQEEIVKLDIPNAAPIILRRTGNTHVLVSGL